MKDKRPKRSLGTILILWFLVFSIVPMGCVAIYSFLQFQKAIDKELSQRLKGNLREIEGVLNEKTKLLKLGNSKIRTNPTVAYNLAVRELDVLQGLAKDWINEYSLSRVSFFARDGKMINVAYRGNKNEIKEFVPEDQSFFLIEKTRKFLISKSDNIQMEFFTNKKISLILTSKILSSNGKLAGYSELVFDLDKNFIDPLKNKLNLEVLFLNPEGLLGAVSQQDFYLFKKDFFLPYLPARGEYFFDMRLKSVPYRFLTYRSAWEGNPYYIAIGAPKSEIENVLRNLNFAFVSIFLVVILLLIVTLLITTSWVLRPLYDLVDAIRSFESSQGVVRIPVRSNTEIGLLTAAFNDMSQKIFQAKSELQKKISELELANKELRDTQTHLVHSAKMVSLGQLVAGVAHELNNPIGFIYSNMTHLRDYTEKLMLVLRRMQEDPKGAAELMEEYEVDYIAKDLPKLISSCEDGARRTRDIVMGLRNFSRLEEAKLTEIDLHQCLDTTLNLLAGEIKGRIVINKNYESVPLIKCYGSQIGQVFMNLLSNAVQAIEGSGQIWISVTHHKEVFNDRISRVQISIQDSGKGIAPEQVEKIFDPFFTTKPVGQGTGLGLSISYGIIHNHGGEIQVRSELGVGTEFTVVIPIFPTGLLSK